MLKKEVSNRLSFIGLLLLLLIPITKAAAFGGVLRNMGPAVSQLLDIIGQMFNPISSGSLFTGSYGIVWAKFLIGGVLYLLIHLILSKGKIFEDDRGQRYAKIISVLLVLIGMIAMPRELTMFLVTTGLNLLLLLAMVGVGGIIIFIFKGDTRPSAFLRGASFILLSALFAKLAESLQSSGWGFIASTWGSDAIYVGALICLIIGIYYLLKSIFMSAESTISMIEGAGKIGGALANLGESAVRRGWGLGKDVAGEAADLGKRGASGIYKGIQWVGDKYDWEKEKREARAIFNGLLGVGEWVGRGILSLLHKAYEKLKRTIKEVRLSNAREIKDLTEIRELIKKLESRGLNSTELEQYISIIEGKLQKIMVIEKQEDVRYTLEQVSEVSGLLGQMFSMYNDLIKKPNISQIREVGEIEEKLREIVVSGQRVQEIFINLQRQNSQDDITMIERIIQYIRGNDYHSARESCERLIEIKNYTDNLMKELDENSLNIDRLVREIEALLAKILPGLEPEEGIELTEEIKETPKDENAELRARIAAMKILQDIDKFLNSSPVKEKGLYGEGNKEFIPQQKLLNAMEKILNSTSEGQMKTELMYLPEQNLGFRMKVYEILRNNINNNRILFNKYLKEYYSGNIPENFKLTGKGGWAGFTGYLVSKKFVGAWKELYPLLKLTNEELLVSFNKNIPLNPLS